MDDVNGLVRGIPANVPAAAAQNNKIRQAVMASARGISIGFFASFAIALNRMADSDRAMAMLILLA